jgi:hypothetical protein
MTGILGWLAAVGTAGSMLVQPLAGLLPGWAGNPPAPSSSFRTSSLTPNLPPAAIRQLVDGPSPGQVTLIMDRPFADARVNQVSEQLGTDVVASFPALGHYVLALPRIEISMINADSGIVYFPKLSTHADIAQYLSDNQLTVTRWQRNSDFPGRIALVSLPRIQLQLIDPLRGLFSTQLPRNLDQARLSAWASGINFVVKSYDPQTGYSVMQLSAFAALANLGFIGPAQSLTQQTVNFTPPPLLPATVPAPPTALTSQPGTLGVKLAWGAGAGAMAYAVYRSSAGSSGYTYIGQTTVLTFTDTVRLELLPRDGAPHLLGDDRRPRWMPDLATDLRFAVRDGPGGCHTGGACLGPDLNHHDPSGD